MRPRVLNGLYSTSRMTSPNSSESSFYIKKEEKQEKEIGRLNSVCQWYEALHGLEGEKADAEKKLADAQSKIAALEATIKALG